MNIEGFTRAHIARAQELAMEAYAQECAHVECLPAIYAPSGLDGMADNGLGVALSERGQLVGFLCCEGPVERLFGLSSGAYTPAHAHGAVSDGRAHIYDLLYQAAAERWVERGILSHAITLYAHDSETIRAFFYNGFGGRCMDAARPTAPVAAPRTGFTFKELGPEDADAMADMERLLDAHFSSSPLFMPRAGTATPNGVRARMAEEGCHAFGAFDGGVMAAYIRTKPQGEHFATGAPDMANITGAFTLPSYRGSGVYAALLGYLMDWLRERGFVRCGVDFESFNPAARRFWLKYFTPYTLSVARRIDERILQ